MIRNLVKGLRIFKRNKVPMEIKILGIAIYFQTSLQEKAKILSEFHKVSYNAVRRWIKKIEERLHIAMEKKKRVDSDESLSNEKLAHNKIFHQRSS